MTEAPSWRYTVDTESSRDLRLDLLRGVCLFKMVFNHLWKTPLHLVQHWLGWVTAAEGFFFISGVVVGIVHGRRSRQLGLAATSRQLWSRSAQLYLANLAFVLLFVSLESAGYLREPRFLHLWQDGFEGWPLFGLSHPYFLSVLPRYVVFLAFTPLALWLLRAGRTGWLVALSTGLWAVNLAFGGGLRIPLLEGDGFPVISWQLLFFGGVVIGWHRRRIGEWWRRTTVWPWLVGGLWLTFAVLKGAMDAGWLAGGWLPPGLVDRDALGPLRLVNLTVAFAFFFLVADRCWQPLRRLTGGLLLAFGQRSLYVFLMHIPLVFLGAEALARWRPEWQALPLVLIVLDALGIALLWAMVRGRFLFRWVPA